MQIYLDLIWLLNLLFDWTILLLVAWLTKSVYSKWRVFFGALFASLIIPLSIGLGLTWLLHPIVKIVYSVGIVMIAFSVERWKVFITQYLSFYLVNFTIGGGIYGLYQFFDTTYPLSQLSQSYGNVFSWISVVILFPIVLYLTKNQFHKLTLHRINEQQLYPVQLTYDNQSVDVHGFIDSGNQLKHPISKKPVILIDEPTASELFGKEMTNKMLHQSLHPSKENQEPHIQLIPYKAAGGGDNVMPAILLDELCVDEGMYSHRTKQIYVGVQRGYFSKQLNFQVLLQPAVFHTKTTRVFHSKGVS